MKTTALVLCAALLSACGGGNAASNLAKPPEFNPDDQTKCKVKTSQSKPLIVEWPSADRGELEAKVGDGKVVVVRYDGCEMRLLSHCKAPGSYAYKALTPKEDTVTIEDEDQLYASIPVYAAKFEGKLATSGQLNVAMTMVGRYEADRIDVSEGDLEGRCDGATHIIAGLTAGAFEFFAGADAEVGGGISVMDAGVGAKSAAKRETLTRDGDKAACAGAAPDAVAPPTGCGALLRVEVLPLAAAKAPTAPPATSATQPNEGPTSPPPATEPSASLPEQPTQDDVRTAMKGMLPMVTACRSLVDAKTTVSVRLKVASSGRVTHALPSGGPTKVNSCVGRAARGAKFPKFSKPTFEVLIPFVLTP